MSSANEISLKTEDKIQTDIAIRDIASKVLEEAAAEFAKEQKFSDSILTKLHSVYGAVFERALELYEKGKVSKIIVSEPKTSGIWKEIDDARWLIEVQGLSGEAYILFPDVNFCPCAAFRYQVIRDQSDLTCKHVLVAWLAALTPEKLIKKELTRAQFRSLWLYQWATCYCSDNGLKVTVEDFKCLQASAYIPISVFQEFNLVEDVVFKINLTVLVECLGMFWSSMSAHTGSSVVLQLYYKGIGHPVSVLIEEDGIITDCSLKTFEPDDLLDFNMEPDSILNKIILSTDLLKDIWGELDPTTELIELILSPDAPYFRISTSGLAGECHIDLPHESELIDNFSCTTKTAFCYQYTHVKPATKVLTCANKVSIRVDKAGLLHFQYLVKAEDGHTCYIEYYLSPVINTDE